MGRIRDSCSFAAVQRSEIGRYEGPMEVSLPGFGIGMVNEDFHIVTERLKMAVMYSLALGPRCFKWKILSLSRPNGLLFLQLLIVLLTSSMVNICAISKDFLFISLVTNRVLLKEVCLPSFDVLNCWLNLAASCPDDEYELPLKVIAHVLLFNGSPQLGDIRFLVQCLNKISPFLPFVCVDAVLHVIIQSWQFRPGGISFTDVISSCHLIQYLCWCRLLVDSVPSSRDVV